VCESGNLRLATKIGVPKATAAGWRRRGCREVLTLDSRDKETAELRRKVHRLEARADALLAIVRLLLVLVRLRGARLDGERLPEGAAKEQVLNSIKRATSVLKLDTALRVVGLSASRYHAWRQTQQLCQLDDRSSCPKTTPTQLTAAEVSTIHEMVTDDDYRHIPVSGLAILAQRMGRVFAAPGTWGKLIREWG
jgi:hypothetical protein